MLFSSCAAFGLLLSLRGVFGLFVVNLFAVGGVCCGARVLWK